MDRQQNVHHPDLERVWRIASDGRKASAVRGVHAHELATATHVRGAHPMGLRPDSAGNSVYVAVYGRNAVLRVGADGKVTTVARTPAPWGPSGVTLAPNGDLWILEFSTTNQARVRRVARDGRVTVF